MAARRRLTALLAAAAALAWLAPAVLLPAAAAPGLAAPGDESSPPPQGKDKLPPPDANPPADQQQTPPSQDQNKPPPAPEPSAPPEQPAPEQPPAQQLPAQQPAPEQPAPEQPAPEQPAAPQPPPPKETPKPPKNLEPLPKEDTISVLGKKVHGPAGEDMGRVVDLLLDRDAQLRAVVIDFGGFLGVGSRKIAIDWQLVRFVPDDHDAPIALSLGKAEVQAAPEYKDTAQPPVMVGPPPPDPDAAR